MALHFRTGKAAIQGGTDLVISLTPAQSAALGGEAGTLAEWFDTALWITAVLRSKTDPDGNPYAPGPDGWHTAINDLDSRLIPRLEGIRDAVVRAQAAAGGSVGDLALAMDVARSTAQYRRESLLAKDPSLFEDWAVNGGPERPAAQQD
ncbi:hypothetical protein [Kitasatospora sp. MBT66]|uniref:hypothetical protein n=1 Tax=Kitasatospora sp. MBT66 TaxID=1444769 RepID=UPI00068EBEA5|nr:hypothetical protein [Kitasatospora sp. MBT66]